MLAQRERAGRQKCGERAGFSVEASFCLDVLFLLDQAKRKEVKFLD